MKKRAFLLFFILTCFACPSFCDENENYTIEEYSAFFEMGELEENVEDENVFKFKKKEKIDETGEDVINLKTEPIKLKTPKIAKIKGAENKTEDLNGANFKKGRFSFSSSNKSELSDYMTPNFKSVINASYRVNKKLNLNAGHETTYLNSNAMVSSRKIYINPRLNLYKGLYLDYNGKFNEVNKNIEQEVGLNFAPKFLHENAVFGVKAGAVTNSDGELKSNKIKFSTDFYFF